MYKYVAAIIVLVTILFLFLFPTNSASTSKVRSTDFNVPLELTKKTSNISIEDISTNVIEDTSLDTLSIEQDSAEKSYAIESFAHSIDYGDTRTPPISTSLTFRGPSFEQLNDEHQYLEYENSKSLQMKAQYLAAARQKVTDIDDWIAIGKSNNISAELLKEALNKKAALEKVMRRLNDELSCSKSGC